MDDMSAATHAAGGGGTCQTEARRYRPGADRALEAAPVGGSTLFTKIKIAFSGESLIRFLITYTNCPTVKSAGTRYLHPVRQNRRISVRSCDPQQPAHPAGVVGLQKIQQSHFFLSMSTISLLSAFSTMTGMRSGYLSRIRAASCLRFSVVARGQPGKKIAGITSEPKAHG